MTWVAAAAASVAVTTAAVKYVKGKKQEKEGASKEAGLVAPEFEIPIEISQNMSEAEKMAYVGLPDDQKRAFLENSQRASQAALRSTDTRKGGLGMISQIQAQEDRSNLSLLQQDVAARRANMGTLMQTRGIMAEYKMKRFEHDYNEYSADLDYARAIQGAGIQNQNQALSEAGRAAASFAGSYAGASGGPQQKTSGGDGGVGTSGMSYGQYKKSSWAGENPLSRSEWNTTSIGQKNAFGQYVGTAENPGAGWNPSTDNPYNFQEWQGSTFNTSQYDWVRFPNNGKTY